jgi:hypothetical protein
VLTVSIDDVVRVRLWDVLVEARMRKRTVPRETVNDLH